MNTFYFFEGNIYETKDQAERAAQHYSIKRIDSVQTIKPFIDFILDYEKARDEGNSCADSIEWAK